MFRRSFVCYYCLQENPDFAGPDSVFNLLHAMMVMSVILKGQNRLD